jgi:hypothetical protein
MPYCRGGIVPPALVPYRKASGVVCPSIIHYSFFIIHYSLRPLLCTFTVLL